MRKSCGGWCVRRVGNRSVPWALAVVTVWGIGMWGPHSLTITRGFAQVERSLRDSRPAGPGNSAPTVDTDDGAEAGHEGKNGATRSESSESILSSIAHTSVPIMVVTIVIAAMSFYLIALVVWMAIHYRVPAAIPPDLVREVQNLLDQHKFNEAYHRLAEDPSFLARVLASGVRNCHWVFRKPTGPWSYPTKMQRWRWNIERPTSPQWGRWDR